MERQGDREGRNEKGIGERGGEERGHEGGKRRRETNIIKIINSQSEIK